MKILLVHSDFIEYEAKKKAIESAEQLVHEKERIEECLVVFTAAEAGDDQTVVAKTVKEIENVAVQVKAHRIVIYPFVHLSSSPAKPSAALDLVKQIAEGLQGKYEVHRAPFGWYKGFDIKCKGHPLSELSREIRPDGAAPNTYYLLCRSDALLFHQGRSVRLPTRCHCRNCCHCCLSGSKGYR